MSKLEKIDPVGLAGAFLLLEGCISIVASTDQRPLSTFGRFCRIAIGAGLVITKW
jgi:hypothetical protein